MKIVLLCLLGTTSALSIESYPNCASDVTAESTGFRCTACENHKIDNLVTVIQGETPCILSGKKDAHSTVLTLVQTPTLAAPICKSGEGPKYSWEKEGHVGFTCESKYEAVFAQQNPTPAVRNFLQQMGQQELLDEPLSEPMQSIKGYKYNTPHGEHFVTEVWPKEGTCTEKDKCMLYVHLHALFESYRPSLPFCGNVPQYVTNDEDCFRKLHSAVLIPQLGDNWMVENWSPDHTLFGKRAEYKDSFDKYLFPLVEGFLEEHANIDRDRVHVGGGSSGGNGAMYAALRRPDIFSLVVASDPCAKHFLTDAEDLKLIAEMPEKRRLRRVIVARGDWADVESICNDAGFTLDVVEPLAKKVPTEVRLYSGLGHGTWGHTFNQYPELHEMIISGTAHDVF